MLAAAPAAVAGALGCFRRRPSGTLLNRSGATQFERSEKVRPAYCPSPWRSFTSMKQGFSRRNLAICAGFHFFPASAYSWIFSGFTPQAYITSKSCLICGAPFFIFPV